MGVPLKYQEGIKILSKHYHIEEQYLLDMMSSEPYNIHEIRTLGFGGVKYLFLYGCLDKYDYWWWQVQSRLPSQDFIKENYKFATIAGKLKFCPPYKIDEILEKYNVEEISLIQFVQDNE